MSDLCRSCNAPIRWVVTEKSALADDPKSMPIDPEPVDGGNVELVVRLGGALVVARVHGQATIELGPRYVSHFVTCPNADQWRNQ